MKELFLSVILFSYGGFCDFCAAICTASAENCIAKNKGLNKKLLTFMSNFSDRNFICWQKFENKFIAMLSADNKNLP